MSEYIINDPDFVLFDNYYASRSYNPYIDCAIIDVPIAYFPVQFVYGIQKQSPYFDAFWFQLNRLKESGATKQILERYETESQVISYGIIFLIISKLDKRFTIS